MGKLVTARDLSKIFGKTERTIFRWKDEGMPRVDGKYDTAAVHEWLVQRAMDSRLSETADGKILDLNAERARHSKEQADKLEMENAVRRGLLMDANHTAGLWSKIAVAAKTRLLAIPSKAAPLLVGKKVAEIKDVLETHVYECALTIAGDPMGESLDATAEVDGKPMGGQKQKVKPGGKRRAG